VEPFDNTPRSYYDAIEHHLPRYIVCLFLDSGVVATADAETAVVRTMTTMMTDTEAAVVTTMTATMTTRK
jgi:hypothetical protein